MEGGERRKWTKYSKMEEKESMGVNRVRKIEKKEGMGGMRNERIRRIRENKRIGGVGRYTDRRTDSQPAEPPVAREGSLFWGQVCAGGGQAQDSGGLERGKPGGGGVREERKEGERKTRERMNRTASI